MMIKRLTLDSVESWFKNTKDEFSHIFSTGPKFDARRWVQ